MSGHSKWANIQATKGVADKRRAILFTKYARLVTVAAKEGGSPDPATNFKLRMAMEKARGMNIPKENIARAVARAFGGGEGESSVEVLYEVLALGGRAALLVVGMTENKNRTLSGVRLVVTKNGGTMGAAGAVSWMFEKRGVLRLEGATLTAEQQLQLIDDGATDFLEEEGGVTVYTAPEKFWLVLHCLEGYGIKPTYAELDWVAKNPSEFTDEEFVKLQQLVAAIENVDDVEKVYTNAA